MKSPNLSLAKNQAQDLLIKFKINNPPISPDFIANKLGIKVMDCNFEDDSISGYYDFEDETIYVNINEFDRRQQFTIAHELGHAVLHKEWAASKDYSVLYRDQQDSSNPKEIEANEFAGNLLVPDNMLLDQYSLLKKKYSYSNNDIIQYLSNVFIVSTPVIRIRMEKIFGTEY